MKRRGRFVWVVLGALALGLLLGACGDDGDGGGGGDGDLTAFCEAAQSIGTAGNEPEVETMRGFIDRLEENAPAEIEDDVSILARFFRDIMDKYEDDPDAQLSPDDVTEEVQAAQASFQTYIEGNCPQFSPEPDTEP